jgi:hypothetical protein
MFALIWVAIAVNLTAFDRYGELWVNVRLAYGPT